MDLTLRMEALRVIGLCDSLEAKVGLSLLTRWRVKKARFLAGCSFVTREQLSRQRQVLVGALLAEQASRQRSLLSTLLAGGMAAVAPLLGLFGIFSRLGIGPSALEAVFANLDARAGFVALALMTLGIALILWRTPA